MSGRHRMVGDTVIVEAARIAEHHMTENLFGHMEDLREILDGIPPQYRGAAKVGIWGDDLVVTYERPATSAEMEAERAALEQGLQDNGRWLRSQIETVLRDAARLGVDPTRLGLAVTPDSYVIAK